MRASFCLVRQARPKHTWADPSVQEFHRNWIVRWSLAGQKKPESGNKVAPGRAEICPACLAAVKPDPTCTCQAALRKAASAWLKEWLKTAEWAAQEQRIDVLRQLRAPTRKLLFGKVVETYTLRGPNDRAQRVAALRSIVEESTGEKLEGFAADGFDQKLVSRWAVLRQEYSRRGWADNRSRNAPSNAWQVLRREYAAGTLPLLDKRTSMECNTTIRSYLTKAKSIMGTLSRATYLEDLADALPPVDRIKGLMVKVAIPKGRQIDVDAYEDLFEVLAEVREEDPQLWLVVEMSRRLGLRTVELSRLREHWFDEDDLGRPFVVVKNRPAEGFYVKAFERDLDQPLEVTPEIMEVIHQIKCKEKDTDFVSVWGTRTPGEAEKLIRRGSKWIRKFVPGGSQTFYLFRKQVISRRAAIQGILVAQAGAGHVPGSRFTGSHCVDLRAPVRALTDAELSPEAIRASRRRPLTEQGPV